jgi:hypothetical protein
MQHRLYANTKYNVYSYLRKNQIYIPATGLQKTLLKKKLRINIIIYN